MGTQSHLPRLPIEVDVAIIGAGPVGLAMAIELSRRVDSVVVVDRRPPPELDTLRPQMLVARPGDLANLKRLGVDRSITSILTKRCQNDPDTGDLACASLPAMAKPARAIDLVELASQPPVALVPIGRLQQALLVIARLRRVEVIYDFDAVRLRRHARNTTIDGQKGTSAAGVTVRAKLVVIATGAARALVREPAMVGASQRMIAGVFAWGVDSTWTRFNVAVRGFARPALATVLQTPSTGTAVIVGTPVTMPSDEQLHGCFATAAVERALGGAPLLAPPRPFLTTVSSVARRVLANDGRAPVVIAGDAAQTGHVFTGQTCFINIALAMELCRDLGDFTRDSQKGHVKWALSRYERASDVGAAILARASTRLVRVASA
ncbi:MAG TPA: FAD-dependent oxidoreductase [Kofleriaceae bacterium]|nr:FAD-dependent oxidoreductase [Kofleriaceae bacterium]